MKIDTDWLLSDDALHIISRAYGARWGMTDNLAQWRAAMRELVESAELIDSTLRSERLPTEAATRAGDPSTSRDAAKSVGDLRDSQRIVLACFETSQRRFTDEELVNYYTRYVEVEKCQSHSGLRSRRSELVRAGFLRDSGVKRKMSTGRMAVVWELAR